MDSEEACRLVESGELELGIVTHPPHTPPALEVHTVWPDPLTVVSGTGHPLAGRDRLAPADLARYPAILPAHGTYTRETVEAAFKPLGLALQITLSTNYLETIKMLVEVGLGWSVLPQSMVDGQLLAHEVAGLRLHRRLGIVTHRARTLSNAARALRALLLPGAAASAATET
jgi:DNA-binding transcriptional LysR family regulator